VGPPVKFQGTCWFERMSDRGASNRASRTAVVEINQSIWAVNAEISARNDQAKDVATTKRNRRFVSAKAARLSEAADVARTAARQLAAAKARVLEDVANAEAAGFIVQEDFSVTDSTSASSGNPTRADDYAAAIQAGVTDFVALDEQLARRLHAAAEELQHLNDN
jgi:hypothetical protein